jgi:hypothetical protein
MTIPQIKMTRVHAIISTAIDENATDESAANGSWSHWDCCK